MKRVCILMLLSLFGCGPRIDVSAALKDGRIVFNVPHRGIAGLMGFEVKEGEKTLWAVSMRYEKGRKIIYGVLPTGGDAPAKQTVPPSSDAVPDLRGKKVTIKVEYQYDIGFAPCRTRFENVVEIPSEAPADKKK